MTTLWPDGATATADVLSHSIQLPVCAFRMAGWSALLRTHVVFASQDRHCIDQAEQVNLSVAGNISVTDMFSIAGFNFSFVALLCSKVSKSHNSI